MKKGDTAEIKMIKALKKGEAVNSEIFACKVLQFREIEECLYLSMECVELDQISLDSIYQCEICSDEGKVCCIGRIKDRYYGAEGKIAKMQIENGFYKINIKLVDKQIV